jgi:hypothetical protein
MEACSHQPEGGAMIICHICEMRNATFSFREGTKQERGVCSSCLSSNFKDNTDLFLKYVYGTTNLFEVAAREPQPVVPVPEGDILIALEPLDIRIPNPNICRLVVSTAQTVATESFVLLLHGSLNPLPESSLRTTL